MVRDASGVALHGFMFDVTEQQRLEVELRQAQKLESVGRLAAGVAHEINTPVQFVSDSVHFVQGAIDDLVGLIDRYRGLRPLLVDAGRTDEAGELEQAETAADLDYLVEHVPRALQRSLDGLGRVASIVRAMKSFAHSDQQRVAADLNAAIASTLVIATNEYKYVADVDTRFGELPAVMCHVGELNQAFLNIIVNAAHAIADQVAGSDRRGRISISTGLDGGEVVVRIADDGGGIPDDVRDRIFDPFFTTKEVGRGTGQGLAIARNIVVDKHKGSLAFETEAGRGTIFVIRVPVGEDAPAAEALVA
jgi:signal transduction histidine kinase